jgi:predicted HicB family RNase H-like nuclease
MDNILKYKNFMAVVKYSEEDEAFIGRIEGINSVVSFEGQSVMELKSSFKEAVDSYLDFCARKGVTQHQKSYSGVFNVRIDSDLHRRAATMAKMNGRTLNSFVKESIEKNLESVRITL